MNGPLEDAVAPKRIRLGVLFTCDKRLRRPALPYLILRLNQVQRSLQFELLDSTQHELIRLLDSRGNIERSDARALVAGFVSKQREYIAEVSTTLGMAALPPDRLVLVSLAMIQVWLGLQVRSVGYELSAVRTLHLKLENRRRELDLESATQRERARLVADARRRLGLVEPKRGQVVDLR